MRTSAESAIHLDEGHVGARRVRHVGGLEESRALEAGLDAEGRRRRARQARQVGEGHAPLGAPRDRRTPRRIARDRPPRTPRARAASRRALSRTSRAARATALPPTTAARLANEPDPVLDARGVARDDGHVLGRDAELVGRDLGQRRLEPLALGGHAAPRRDAPRRVHPHARALEGADAGQLHVAGDAHADQAALRRARRRPRRTAPRSARSRAPGAAPTARRRCRGSRGRCRGSSAARCPTACPRRAPGWPGAPPRGRVRSRAPPGPAPARSRRRPAAGPAPRYGVTGTRWV